MAAVLLVGLVVATSLILRRSSRGIAIIVEAAVVLLVALPIASVQTFADLNRAYDDGPWVEIDVTVSSCQATRGRRSRHYIALGHPPLRVRPADAQLELPSEIRAERWFCERAAGAGEVTLTVGRGALGQPWYREIYANGHVWRAP